MQPHLSPLLSEGVFSRVNTYNYATHRNPGGTITMKRWQSFISLILLLALLVRKPIVLPSHMQHQYHQHGHRQTVEEQTPF